MDTFDKELADLDARLDRLQDLAPLHDAYERLWCRIKGEDFRAGRGPDGPHRALKASTLKRHRTGVALYNTGGLADSYATPGATGYSFQADQLGFEHRSTHPAVAHLAGMGFHVDGLSAEQWALFDQLTIHFLETGEILNV